MELHYAADGITKYSVILYPDGGGSIYFYIETGLQKLGMVSLRIPRGTSPLAWAKRHYAHFGEVVKPYWQAGFKDEEARMRQYLLKNHGEPTFDLEDYS